MTQVPCKRLRECRSPLLLLGLSHFLIDFSCTCLLTRFTKSPDIIPPLLLAMIYNGLAFAFQLPIGALADRLDSTRRFSCIGCVLVAAGCFLNLPLVSCVLLGLGNAFFHVGGGRESLKRGGVHAGPVGKFVAPGAIGIFLGPLSASFFPWMRYIAPVLLLLCAGLFLPKKEIREQDPRQLTLPIGRLFALMLCMFFTVLIRSYMGTVIHYEFQSKFHWAALFVLCIFGGKLLGGIFADRCGAFRFSLISQLCCTVLFTLSPFCPVLAFPAILLFNTTMAITASTLYRCLPAYGGTMFGLTTFALFFGVVPKLLGWRNVLFSWWGLLLLGLCSTFFLLAGLHLTKKELKHAH